MSRTKPSADELATAPMIDNWELRRAVLSVDRHQLYGVFYGHPEIVDGTRGHSSDVVLINDAEPPCWAICESRTYVLGERKNSGLSSSQGPATKSEDK